VQEEFQNTTEALSIAGGAGRTRRLAIPTGPVPRLQPIDRHTRRRPKYTGGDREGAVYGAIFTDFAMSVGLDVAASAYFKANALTFGEYRDFIHRTMPQHDAALEKARVFWGL
jgi:hypothetical protein